MGKTILIVDDEEIVRELLEYALEEEGFEVLTAENGFQAIEMFGDSSLSCDLAIVDFSMPGMDGLEVCRKMAEMRPSQKLMISTGSYSTDEEIEEIKKNGILEVIRKPFNVSDVLRLLNDQLGCH
jgi:CheY-like chemotaxis protein